MPTRFPTTTSLRTAPRAAALGAALTLVVGCGGGDGLRTQPPVTAKGQGSGGAVSSSKLVISMPVDMGMLTTFTTKAKDLCGAMLKCEFHVVSVKVTFDIGNSLAIMNFESAFSGDLEVKLKPGAGTGAGVPIATVKKPTGGGTLDAAVATDQKLFDSLKDDILAASLVVEVSGPTMWNTAETKKIGLITALVLEAVGKS